MNNFLYTKAKDIRYAVERIGKNASAEFIAGGTNIIDLWKYNLTAFDELVDVNDLNKTPAVTQNTDGSVRLNAFATNSETAYHPIIEKNYPVLSRAILAGASAQIRNMATNGGNLLQRTRCYYFYDGVTSCNKRVPGSGCSALEGYNRMHAILGTSKECIAVFPSDMCVALAALEAVVNVSGLPGERRIAFTDFHRLPGNTPEIDNSLQHGEIITSIEIPAKGFEKNYSYLKLRDRSSYAFALVSVATCFELDNNIIKEARIVLGGVAHKPWRIKEAEYFLREQPAIVENFSMAADIILTGAQTYKYNSFKPELAKRAIIRNCLMALDPGSQLPGAKPSL